MKCQVLSVGFKSSTFYTVCAPEHESKSTIQLEFLKAVSSWKIRDLHSMLQSTPFFDAKCIDLRQRSTVRLLDSSGSFVRCFSSITVISFRIPSYPKVGFLCKYLYIRLSFCLYRDPNGPNGNVSTGILFASVQIIYVYLSSVHTSQITGIRSSTLFN